MKVKHKQSRRTKIITVELKMSYADIEAILHQFDHIPRRVMDSSSQELLRSFSAILNDTDSTK